MSTSCGPIGVITRVERRRRSDGQKLRILAEAARSGMTVTAVCARYKITSGLLYSWRHQQRRGELGRPGTAPAGFLEVQVAAEAVAPSDPAVGMIEVLLPNGCRARVDGKVDGAALRRVLAALTGG